MAPLPFHFYIELFLRPLSLFICIAILISIAWSNHKNKPNPNPMRPAVLRATYYTILCFVMSNIAGLIRLSFIIEPGTQAAETAFDAVLVIFWNLAQVFIYILLMLRLHHSFQGTKYAIPRRVYITFSILLALYGAASMLYIIHDMIARAEEQQYKAKQLILYNADIGAFGIHILHFTF